MREVYEGLLARSRRDEKIAEYQAALSCPPLPPALGYLWKSYRRLRRRKGDGFGRSPIEWPDIDAFLRHSGASLAPWEIEIIEDIDDLFLTVNSSKPATPDKTEF